jgi:hypothetical protein
MNNPSTETRCSLCGRPAAGGQTSFCCGAPLVPVQPQAPVTAGETSLSSGEVPEEANAAPDGVQANLPKGRSRKWPWIVLGLLALLLVLRETGLVNLDLYQFNSTQNTESSYEGVMFGGFGGQATEPAEVKANNQTVAAQAAADALREMQPAASVDLERLDISGLYWLPLYKQGTCDFAASYHLHGTVHGQVHGHIDCTVTGVCSAYTYRQLIGQLVAKEIAREINR